MSPQKKKYILLTKVILNDKKMFLYEWLVLKYFDIN